MVLQNEEKIKEQQMPINAMSEDKELNEFKELQEQYTELNKVNIRYKGAGDCGVNTGFKSEVNKVNTKFTKSEDGGYTSSCSSNGQQIEEYAEQNIHYETANNSEQSSDGELSKKQSKVFYLSLISIWFTLCVCVCVVLDCVQQLRDACV